MALGKQFVRYVLTYFITFILFCAVLTLCH